MEAFYGHRLENKSDLEFNFTPENTPDMFKLDFGKPQECHKWCKNQSL